MFSSLLGCSGDIIYSQSNFIFGADSKRIKNRYDRPLELSNVVQNKTCKAVKKIMTMFSMCLKGHLIMGIHL